MTMDNYSYELENNINKKPASENVIAGIVGAFLFSLAGGALWFIFGMLGIIASISGLVGAVCAIKGYSVFAKKESTKGIVISVIISLLVMVLAWYLSLGYDIYVAYQDWYAAGEVDFTLSYFESVQAAPFFLEDSEIAIAYLKDLGLGLLFCVIGGGSYVANKIKNAKLNANAANQNNDVIEENDTDTTNEVVDDINETVE